jgi:hypothetical protein
MSHVGPVVWQNERTVGRDLANRIFSQDVVWNFVGVTCGRRMVSPTTEVRNVHSSLFFLFQVEVKYPYQLHSKYGIIIL